MTGDREWRDRAACKGRTDINWFPIRGEDMQPALNVCRTCPVKDACLHHALRKPTPGVWGGTSERQRDRIRARYHETKGSAA